MGSDERHDVALSFGLVLFAGLILGVLVFEPGRGLDPKYVEFHTRVLLAGILMAVLLILTSVILRWEDDEFTPTLWSTSAARGLADKPFAKVAGMIFLVVLFVGGAAAAQHSVIPIINPLDSGHLLGVEQLQGIGNTFLTGLRSGGYAGAGEDLLGFGIVNILTLGLLALSKTLIADAWSIVPLVILCGIISCAVWALLFATGHLLAFGINLHEYVGAAFYAFASQLTNFLVGAPVSVVAHFLHNFTFIFGIGVVLGFWGYATANASKNGTLAGVFLMTPQTLWKKIQFPTLEFPKITPTARRGSAALWIVAVAAIIAVIGAIVYFGPSLQTKLDAGSGQSCGDYVNVPGPVSCTSDADCLTAVVPEGKTLDPGVTLRCATNTCQVRLQECSGTVG